MKHFDFIIIGFGKGGKTLASDLATQGKSVAMIEQSKERYGGTCINIACIPTKFLTYQAEQDERLKTDKQTFYEKAIDNKNETITKLRHANYKNLADQDTVMVYTAKASFVSESKIQLVSETETIQLTADKFIVNTGSTPIIPPINGLADTEHVYTSTELQEVRDLPEKLIIVGGGYIGLEFAFMYANFGSEVMLIDSSSEFMEKDDEDISKEVLKLLKDKQIKIAHGSRATAVSNHSDGIEVTYTNEDDNEVKETASLLLLATGRKPYTEGLELGKAGVEVNGNGTIVVDDYLRTTNQNIWALGDVNGGPQFTYISLDDYRIVRDQVVTDGNYSLAKRKNIPYSIFIEPVLSHVGYNEKKAQRENKDYVVATMPAASIPRTKINKQPNGLLKALVDSKTKRILGCTILSEASSELINIVRVTMEADLPYTFLRDNIYTHPTMSEGLNDLFKMIDAKLS